MGSGRRHTIPGSREEVIRTEEPHLLLHPPLFLLAWRLVTDLVRVSIPGSLFMPALLSVRRCWLFPGLPALAARPWGLHSPLRLC